MAKDFHSRLTSLLRDSEMQEIFDMFEKIMTIPVDIEIKTKKSKDPDLLRCQLVSVLKIMRAMLNFSDEVSEEKFGFDDEATDLLKDVLADCKNLQESIDAYFDYIDGDESSSPTDDNEDDDISVIEDTDEE